jgi:hypothetical protein
VTARAVLAVVLFPRLYRLGVRECFDSCGMTYGHPYSWRSVAYDTGRACGDRRLA